MLRQTTIQLMRFNFLVLLSLILTLALFNLDAHALHRLWHICFQHMFKRFWNKKFINSIVLKLFTEFLRYEIML